jgi:hypothetical protein
LTSGNEGRETQAAESWRILKCRESGAEDQKETLAILRFKAITMMRLRDGATQSVGAF